MFQENPKHFYFPSEFHYLISVGDARWKAPLPSPLLISADLFIDNFCESIWIVSGLMVLRELPNPLVRNPSDRI